MTSQVITVNRKKYAVGLFWQPTGAGHLARSYAKVLARSIDKKLNLFTEYRTMVGLGAKKSGHRVGMESMAAAVTDALTEYSSFLAVFIVDKFFFLIAVRNGIILEDKLFENEEDARAEYFKLSEIPDWNALFAPSTWGMPRAVERNISDLIINTPRSLLRPISRVSTGIMSVVLLVAFCLSIGYLFREPINQIVNSQPKLEQVDPELAAEYQKQVEEKNKELDAEFNIQKAPQPEPLVMPYDYLPDPMERAEICYQAMGFVMQPVLGWNQSSVECGETHAGAWFVRNFGTLGDFYNFATELMPRAFVQEESENSLYVRVKLPAINTYASLDERDVDTVMREVTTAFQSIDSSFDMQAVVDTLTNGVDTAYINVIEISADSKLVPMQFMKIFENFDGVYMTRCSWNVSTRTWNYEVIIYVK